MSSYNKYFSPAQVESDQKDLIISQMKAEIFELRQNDRDYQDLSGQFYNLDHRYNILQEEKLRGEIEYKNRNDLTLKTIANLKTDVDTLKSNISEKNIEYQELKSENIAIKDIAEHRIVDISKLKNELGSGLDLNSKLTDEKRTLETQLSLLREEKRKLVNQSDNVNSDVDNLLYKNNELEKAVKELEYDKNRIEKHNSQLAASIDNLSIEHRTRSEHLKFTESEAMDSQKHILGLEADCKDLERTNEKSRSEALQTQKHHQKEVSKNLELTAKSSNLENVLRSKEIQLDDHSREIESLKNAHNNALDHNFQLNSDLETIHRQIDGLQNHNGELVEELEKFSEQDEHVRSILNRRNRVKELKVKSDSHTKLSISTIANSPSRKFKSSYRKSP